MSSVDTNVFMRPTPAQVAALVASHEMEAAVARWWWLDERTLGSLAQAGRAAKGEVLQSASKRRSYSDLDAAVCVEASYILGSATRGERAAGMSHNVTQGLFPRRGLPYVCISPAERGRAASIGNLAKAGNAEAIAEREQRHAHELAVGQVLRAALALVPDQPLTGRYRLPPVDDALRIALAGLSPAAIEAAFPALAVVDAPADAPAEEVAPVAKPAPLPDPAPLIEVPAVSEPIPHIHRRAPDDSVMRFDHADGQDLVVLAAHYGISPPALYAHWRRLNLSGRGRMAGFAAAQRPAEDQVVEATPQESVTPDVPVEPAAQEPVATSSPVDPYGALSPEEAISVVADIEASAPLGLHHLTLAVRLAAETGLSKAEAIEWVRADIHFVASSRVIPAEETVMTAAMADQIFSEILWADEQGTRQ